MASQQIQFAETIRAMKLALKRKPDDSDSDDSIHAHTNRGHKLKRRARFVHEGRLDNTGGLSYRKTVDHAGYTRQIIATKPPLYDEDGDVYSPVESDEENGAAPLRDDPFGEVRLERLLRPLTTVSELSDHPGLSTAFKSKILMEMAEEALEMMRREKASLWKAKRLLQRFRGDADWVPCGVFETEQDEIMLLQGDVDGEVASIPSVMLDSTVAEVDGPSLQLREEERNGVGLLEGEAMEGVDSADMALVQREAIDRVHATSDPAVHEGPIVANGEVTSDAEPSKVSTTTKLLENPTVAELRRSADPDGDAEAGSEATSNSGKETNGTNPPSHAMTTRARARSPQNRSAASPSPTSSDSASVPSISPWFTVPNSSLPDRDLGLPAAEAEDTRKLLLLYVQKQEQIVRAIQTLYEGLQRADRLRHEVVRACKAEGHLVNDGKGNMVTEMSDGEDWYDVDDLGLTRGDLKALKDGRLGLEKGKDEVEDVEEEGRRGGRRRRGVMK